MKEVGVVDETGWMTGMTSASDGRMTRGRTRSEMATEAPVLTAFCPRARDAVLLREAVLPTRRIETYHSWKDFQSAAGSATCAVVVMPWLSEGDAMLRLVVLRESAPSTPIVLITTGEFANVRLTRGLPVNEVLSFEEARTRLGFVVDGIRTVTLLAALATAAAGATHIPAVPRATIVSLCRTRGPMLRERTLATALGISRGRLWREWVGAFGGELRLKDFLDWVLLLRALSCKTLDRSWADVSEALQVHERTIDRTSMRCTQKHVTRLNMRETETLFRVRVLTRLGLGRDLD
jgi:hypothetical protein